MTENWRKAGGVEPAIAGPCYAVPCPCGSCEDWLIASETQGQGVSFTKFEAMFLADMLNMLKGKPERKAQLMALRDTLAQANAAAAKKRGVQ
jgi:hypothetical protein